MELGRGYLYTVQMCSGGFIVVEKDDLRNLKMRLIYFDKSLKEKWRTEIEEKINHDDGIDEFIKYKDKIFCLWDTKSETISKGAFFINHVGFFVQKYDTELKKIWESQKLFENIPGDLPKNTKGNTYGEGYIRIMELAL